MQKQRNKKQDARNKIDVLFFVFVLLVSCILPLTSVRAQNILITRDVCANAVAHKPAPDVEYKPGVDVNDAAVAPADLPGTQSITPHTDITIPLQLNLGRALHLPSNSNLTSPQAVIGTIEYKNGQVTYNGQPVSPDAQAQIQAACEQHAK